MPLYKELDTLRSFTAKLNTAISDASQPMILADLLVQYELVGKAAAKNITSPQGIPDYNKVSRLMSAVYSYVQTVSSKEKATGIFNKLVRILYNDLSLTDLAEQMVKHRGEDDPAYESPLLSTAASQEAVVTETHVTGASATPSIHRDIMQEKPTLAQLTLLKNSSKSKKMEIIKSVTPKWKDFGSLLDFDEAGTHLELLEAQYGRNAMDCCRAMFQYWLQGNGVEATWDKLVELLADSQMSILASDLQGILKSL